MKNCQYIGRQVLSKVTGNNKSSRVYRLLEDKTMLEVRWLDRGTTKGTFQVWIKPQINAGCMKRMLAVRQLPYFFTYIKHTQTNCTVDIITAVILLVNEAGHKVYMRVVKAPVRCGSWIVYRVQSGSVNFKIITPSNDNNLIQCKNDCHCSDHNEAIVEHRKIWFLCGRWWGY